MFTEFKINVAHETDVIVGNSALLRCDVPSFVVDLVSVVSWHDNRGGAYLIGSESYGNELAALSFNTVLVLFLYKALLYALTMSRTTSLCHMSGKARFMSLIALELCTKLSIYSGYARLQGVRESGARHKGK